MEASSKLIDLRNLLAGRFPHSSPTPASVLPTGLPFLDPTIGGGFPKSAITELIAPNVSAGSASLIHALLLSAQRDRHFVALIDGADSFDPASSDNSALRHLLWVRCCKAFDAIKAADFLLRDGNFPLVIVDLVLNTAEELRKIPQTSWYRLQRLVEAVPTACLVLNRQTLVSSAQLKIVLENSWALPDLENQNAISNLRFRIQRFAGANFTAGGRELIANGARGTRDIEGKVTRAGASECGQRTSFNRSREAGDAVWVKTERSQPGGRRVVGAAS